MKLIQKAILPAVVALAGLASVDAMAAGTDAGTLISNQASMTYLAGGASNQVSDTADVLVDVKIDFNFTDATTLNTTSATTLGDSNNYYLSAGFTLTNTSNTNAFFQLAATALAADNTGTFDVNGTATTPDAAATGTLYYIVDTDTDVSNDTPVAASTANLLELAEDATSGTIYIVVPTSQVSATDGDVIGFSVQATAAAVTIGTDTTPVAVTNDSGEANVNDDIQFVFANTGTGTDSTDYDNTEITYAGATLSNLPNFGNGPDNNSTADDGFVKTATVLWDPIRGTNNPKALPGALVQYTVTLQNIGTGDAGTTTITDNIAGIGVSVCANNTVLTGVTDYTCGQTSATYLDASDVTAVSELSSVPTATWSGTTISTTYSEFAAGYSGVITFYVTID